MIAKERLYLTRAGRVLQENCGNYDFLLVCEGGEIEDALAAHYGIVDGRLHRELSDRLWHERNHPVQSQAVTAAPENKSGLVSPRKSTRRDRQR